MRAIGVVFLLIALTCAGVCVQAFAIEPLIFACLFGVAGLFLTFHKQPLQ